MKFFFILTLIFLPFYFSNAQTVNFDDLESNFGVPKSLTFNISNYPRRTNAYRFQTANISTVGGVLKLQHLSSFFGWREIMVFNGQNVGIGTLNPDARLTVNGTIHAKEVKVDLSIPADYVFEKYYTGFSLLKPAYNMPTLEEVESFIKENKHLPEMPSADEIKEKGLHLKEMTNLLLQKVEELTLYTIEQQKEIEELKRRLNSKN